jgi:ketosteroid isomerase-like protein
MSQENVELVRRLYQAFNEGTGYDLIPDLWHTDAQLHPALIGGGVLEGTVYRGHEGIREFLAIQAETWESLNVEPVDIRDMGAHLLVETRLHAVGRASGVDLTDVTWNVWEIREGKVATGRVFLSEREARKAVGLAE